MLINAMKEDLPSDSPKYSSPSTLSAAILHNFDHPKFSTEGTTRIKITNLNGELGGSSYLLVFQKERKQDHKDAKDF